MRKGASFRTALIGAFLLAVATSASGTLVATQAAAVTPATKVPVTLDSPLGDIPSPFTAASLTGISLPLGGITSVTVLTVEHGTSAWSVQLAVTGKSGFTPLADSVVLALAGPTSSALTLTSGSPAPASTSAVSLGTASDLSVTARGVCAGTCVITAELRFLPASGAVPAFVLPVTLGVT